MKTAAIYLRLSNDDGRAGESQSVDAQRQDCTAYAKRHGWAVREFADDGFSGSKEGVLRPGFERMLEAMADGEVVAVIAAKQDRITRRGDVWEDFKKAAALTSCAVHTVEAGDLRLDSDAGVLSGDIRSAFSSFEARVIGSRTRRGLENARAQGRWTGRTMFGYSKGGVINPGQAKWVRWAYDEILERGTTTREVFERFRAEGVMTARGKEFYSVNNLISTLKAPVLAGLVTHKGEIVGNGTWESIVSPAERERLIAAFAARRTVAVGHGKRTARRYALAGLVLCGNAACDLKTMNAQNPGNGRNHYYYCDPRVGGCKNRAKGRAMDEAGAVIALGFLTKMQQSPRHSPQPYDTTELEAIESQIEEVRALLVSRALRPSDAAPVLRDLNSQLDAARDAQAAQGARVESWHDAQRAAILGDDAITPEIRRVLDNVVVLPGRVGFRWESKLGDVQETLFNDDGSLQLYG